MCHTATYVQATGDRRGQAATGSTGPGGSRSLLFRGPGGQPGSLAPVTWAMSGAPPECSVTPTRAARCACGRGNAGSCRAAVRSGDALQPASRHSQAPARPHWSWAAPSRGHRGLPSPGGDRELAPDKDDHPSNKTRLWPEKHQAFEQNHPRGGLLDLAPLPRSRKTAAATARPDLAPCTSHVRTSAAPRCGN